MTSSGMTHTYRGFVSEPNQHRIGDVVSKKNYGLLSVFEDEGTKRFVIEVKGDDGNVYETVELSY